jgi:hypothetical protein
MSIEELMNLGLVQLAKHAQEGWDLANARTAALTAANLQNRVLLKALDDIDNWRELAQRPGGVWDIHTIIRNALEEVRLIEKRKDEGLRCDICQQVKPDTLLRCHDCYMMT